MNQTNKHYYTSFYCALDGVYSSFWIGKLANLFVKKGNIIAVEKQLSSSWISVKLLNKSPSALILESLLSVKPIFNLGSTVSHGKEQQYPLLLSRNKQLQLANKWVSSSALERKERGLDQQVYNEFISLNKDKRHVLFQRRDKIFKLIIKNRSNLRYSK